MLLEIGGLVVADVFAFFVMFGVLGGDAYLVDVGIVITHLRLLLHSSRDPRNV